MSGIDNTAEDVPKRASRAPLEQAQVNTDRPMAQEQLQAVQVGELEPLVGPIHILDYDPGSGSIKNAMVK